MKDDEQTWNQSGFTSFHCNGFPEKVGPRFMSCSHTAVSVGFLMLSLPFFFSFLDETRIPFSKFAVGFYVIQSCTFRERTGGIMLLRIPAFSIWSSMDNLSFIEIQGGRRSNKILQNQFPGTRVVFWTTNNLHNQFHFVAIITIIISRNL